MVDLQSARHWARALQEKAAHEGAVAVDATMGNGGDTEALCRLVGESGLVYAFDVQPAALEATRRRLEGAGLGQRARLNLLGHEHMAQAAPQGVDLIVFNLGWLPGAADKGLTTRWETTRQALQAALALLKKGGLITLCAYPCHQEGARELQQACQWAQGLDGGEVQVMLQRYINQPTAPALLALVKLKENLLRNKNRD